MKNQNRTRNVQLILRVTPREYEHIQKKMALIGTNNFNAYARKMPHSSNVFTTMRQGYLKSEKLNTG